MAVATPFEGAWREVSSDTIISLTAPLADAQYAMQGL